MAKHRVTFTGDPNPKAAGDTRDAVTIYGHTFELDEPKVIEDAPAGAIARLKANSHFKVEEIAAKIIPKLDPKYFKVEPAPVEVIEAPAPAPAVLHPEAVSPQAQAKRAERAAKKAAKAAKA